MISLRSASAPIELLPARTAVLVGSVDFSKDGQRLLVADQGLHVTDQAYGKANEVHLWSLKGLQRKKTATLPVSAQIRAEFSAQGSYCFVVSNERVWLYDENLDDVVEGHATEGGVAALSPDENLLVTRTRTGLEVLNLATRETQNCAVVNMPATAIFSKDGKRLAVAGHDQVVIVDTASMTPLTDISVGKGSDGIHELEFHEVSGRLFAKVKFEQDTRIMSWDSSPPQLRATRAEKLQSKLNAATSLAMSWKAVRGSSPGYPRPKSWS